MQRVVEGGEGRLVHGLGLRDDEVDVICRVGARRRRIQFPDRGRGYGVDGAVFVWVARVGDVGHVTREAGGVDCEGQVV